MIWEIDIWIEACSSINKPVFEIDKASSLARLKRAFDN